MVKHVFGRETKFVHGATWEATRNFKSELIPRCVPIYRQGLGCTSHTTNGVFRILSQIVACCVSDHTSVIMTDSCLISIDTYKMNSLELQIINVACLHIFMNS